MFHTADIRNDASRAEERAASAANAPGRVRLRYLLSLFAGLSGALALFCLTLFALNQTGNLPPPAFSNISCADEKLSFMRHNPIQSPNLLIIGSSVAWRHVDGNVLTEALPNVRPMNGAFCGLFANQSTYVGSWLLDREPSIRSVVMLADPQDFAGCWRVPTEVFKREDVDPYVYENASPWSHYIRYFSPKSLLRNALTVKAQRAGEIEWDPLVFTRFGDGPLDTPNSRELVYGPPEPLDPACFEALRDLGTRLEKDGRQLLVVSTPLHPEWKEKYDPDGSFVADFDRRLLNTVTKVGGTFWDADRDWNSPENAFVDAVHMRWSAVQPFTAALAEQIQKAVPTSLKTADTR